MPEPGRFWRRWPLTALASLGFVAVVLALRAGPLVRWLDWVGWLAGAATGAGLMVAVLGAAAVQRFARATPLPSAPGAPVSVLRPLYGDEPGLHAALASMAAQAYPAFQIVFGVQDAADPALLAVARLRAEHPALDIAVVADPAFHGPNRKVSNLINMLPAARHDMLVFSDSDLHVAPDYLDRLMAALAQPGVGLVTALCTGRPTVPGLASRLGATQITHSFLPGALLSRALGRQDCLGTTMAMQRDTLERAGGLHGLAGHLADDNLLGRQVRRLGLRIALAETVPATGVPETSLAMLWQHELRWARTIRALVPAAFAASALQFPLAWALLACLCSGGAAWTLAFAGAAWLVRMAAAQAVGRSLAGQSASGGASWAAAWLLPLRDVLSVVEIAASYLGVRVMWRGHVMRVDVRTIRRAGSLPTGP